MHGYVFFYVDNASKMYLQTKDFPCCDHYSLLRVTFTVTGRNVSSLALFINVFVISMLQQLKIPPELQQHLYVFDLNRQDTKNVPFAKHDSKLAK